MTTGEKIKKYRQELNVSQEHLADLSEISLSALHKYEANIIQPSENHTKKLAIALGISPFELKESAANLSNFYDTLYELNKNEKLDYLTLNGNVYFSFTDEELTQFITKLYELNSIGKLIDDKSEKDCPDTKILDSIKDNLQVLQNDLAAEYITKRHWLDYYKTYQWPEINNVTKVTDELYESIYNHVSNNTFRFYTVKGRLYDSKVFFDIIGDTYDYLEIEKLLNILRLNGTEIFAYIYTKTIEDSDFLYKRFIVHDLKLTNMLIEKIGKSNWTKKLQSEYQYPVTEHENYRSGNE